MSRSPQQPIIGKAESRGARSLTWTAMAAAASAIWLPVADTVAASTSAPAKGQLVVLGDLVGGGVSLPTEPRVAKRTFEFGNPENIKQGNGQWYLLRMDATVSFAPQTKRGSVILSGFTNGRAAAQVEFSTRPGPDGSVTTSWNAVDFIQGPNKGSAAGRSVHLSYKNFLQFAGMRLGRNRLTFQLERFGRAKLAKVTIGKRSGVYVASAGPVELALDGAFPAGPPTVGEPTDVLVTVTNTGPRLARDVRVALMPESSHLIADGPMKRDLGDVRKSRTVRFVVRRTRPGPLRVKALVSARNGSKAHAIFSEAVTGPEDGNGRLWIFVPAIGLLVGIGLWLRRAYWAGTGGGSDGRGSGSAG